MDAWNVVKVGLLAAVPVVILSAVMIAVRQDAIKEEGSDLGKWIGTWTIVGLVFGVAATVAYEFVSGRWNWGLGQYLAGAVVIAVALSVLAFIKLYDGEAHVWRVEYTILNFVYAVGFGILIPKLAA